MKILIAPDKFKGSLTADEVCRAIQKGIYKYDPKIETILHPLADGGEGTIDILGKLLSLETIKLQVKDPLFRPIFSFYKINTPKRRAAKKTAFIEMATASGLPLLKKEDQNPMHTTTFGTGEMILDAIQKGVEEIYLFIGGSATNDVGIGMAAALGFIFLDKKNNPVVPIGKNLKEINSIDTSQLQCDLSKIKVKVICDVENSLVGKNGAAHVYAAQKGANENEIQELEEGMTHFSNILQEHFKFDFSTQKGAGAAGGLGAGAMAFLNARMHSGIETILELSEFEKKIENVDLVITGEGKVDHQSLQGKVIKGVADFCKKKNIPVYVICGVCEAEEKQLQKIGIQRVGVILKDGITVAQAMSEAAKRVKELMFFMMKSKF